MPDAGEIKAAKVIEKKLPPKPEGRGGSEITKDLYGRPEY